VDIIRERVRNGQLKSGADIRAGCVACSALLWRCMQPPELLSCRLKDAITELLTARVGSSELSFSSQPGVILVVGVNGGGKTTTIGKLAHKFTREGARVLVVPGDTFRAAAGEQLAVWAERAGAAFHSMPEGTRPHTVLYSAVDAALTGKTPCDIVLGDTSGRLHTNAGLMDELAKVKKAVTKRYESAPHETLLVLDGTTGLNMLAQAREFNAAVGLTGLILTKLDGSARGGAVVSVVDELALPVKFVGVGEGIDDLQPFDARAFVSALFDAK
jgi:fused signal recognition particle receptor